MAKPRTKKPPAEESDLVQSVINQKLPAVIGKTTDLTVSKTDLANIVGVKAFAAIDDQINDIELEIKDLKEKLNELITEGRKELNKEIKKYADSNKFTIIKDNDGDYYQHCLPNYNVGSFEVRFPLTISLPNFLGKELSNTSLTSINVSIAKPELKQLDCKITLLRNKIDDINSKRDKYTSTRFIKAAIDEIILVNSGTDSVKAKIDDLTVGVIEVIKQKINS